MNSSLGTILGFGVVAAAAYALYRYLTTGVPTGNTAVSASVQQSPFHQALMQQTQIAPVSIVQTQAPASAQSKMQAAANSNAAIQNQGGQADARQWATLWNQNVGTLLTEAQINSTFFPNGVNPQWQPAVMTMTQNQRGPEFPQVPVWTSPYPPIPAAGMSSQGLPLMSLSSFLAGVKSATGLGYINRILMNLIHRRAA